MTEQDCSSEFHSSRELAWSATIFHSLHKSTDSTGRIIILEGSAWDKSTNAISETDVNSGQSVWWQQFMLYMFKPLYIMTLVDESVITVLC